MFCKNCGKEMKENENVCSFCGTGNYEGAVVNSPKTPQKKVSKNTLIIVIVSALLVIAALVAVIIFQNSEREEDSDDKEVSKNDIVSTVEISTITTIPFDEDALIDIEDKKDNEINNNHSFVKFTMENGESFVVELYPEYAPETVENFLNLVNSGFYNGLTFHRVIEGFMAQGGDPRGDGTGGSDKEIYGEFAENGFTQNTLSHERGVISMARSNNPNSASSQFFICYNGENKVYLDGYYAAFGKVIEGMDVVDSFLNVERLYAASDDAFSRPAEPIVIKSATQIKY